MSTRSASLLPRLRRDARHHQLWLSDTRIVAAVSGGSDSVAMLRLLHDLQVRGELQLVAVAHLHHALRDTADRDELFSRALAAQLALPFVSRRVDVKARARDQRESIEVAGRRARQAFLDEARRELHAHAIATAHTIDDQAETVLMRLMRGTGRRGLGGIRPSRAPFIRPVLGFTRRELQEDLTRRGQPWCEDETNTDVTIARNRVRLELLPFLEQHFNPSARRALARLAEIARAEDDLLLRHASALGPTVVDADPHSGTWRLDGNALQALPLAVSRRVVGHALRAALPDRQPTLEDVDAVLDVATRRRRAVDLGRLRAEPFRHFVVLRNRPAARSGLVLQKLNLPGTVAWDAAGVEIVASGPMPRHEALTLGAEGAETRDLVLLDAGAVGSTLVARSRLPGDRLELPGGGGHKKVQDLFVDRKVARDERDLVPIVCDERGRIVWVAGHAVAAGVAVTSATTGVILLKSRRIFPAPGPGGRPR